jgi:hypothetical protein
MYTIEDLKNGKCAVINDGTLEELREVLDLAFPIDRVPVGGFDKYYFALGNKGIWTSASQQIIMHTQSVKDFLKKENMQTNVSNNSNDPFDVYKPVQISRRDYFAAMAMQGLIQRNFKANGIPEESILYADALIAELDKSRN